MKIFFVAAVQGKGKYGSNYKFIIDKVRSLGHTIINDYIFDISLEQLASWEGKEELLNLHKKIVTGIKKADIVVVETSFQRVSNGYWISISLEYGKPTIAFYTKGTKSFLLDTLELNDKFVAHEYNSNEDLDKEIPLLLEFASDQQDTRFNFFISPKHQVYLDWISKHRKIPRSVYLRRLIEQDIDQNEEYKEE